MLLDAYFDRGSLFPPLGFKAADVTRANVILIGHGHHDHMSDAASVGIRTGATIVGAPLTTAKLLSQSVDPQKIRTLSGRESIMLDFGPFKVEPILGRHGDPPKTLVDAFGGALRATTPKPTDEQLAEFAAIRSRGVQDPRVVTEGTLAYLITLDNGFRIMYRDSGGARHRLRESGDGAHRPRRRRAGGGVGVLPQHRNRRRGRWSMCAPTSPTSTFPRITTPPTTISGARPSRCSRR